MTHYTSDPARGCGIGILFALGVGIAFWIVLAFLAPRLAIALFGGLAAGLALAGILASAPRR